MKPGPPKKPSAINKLTGNPGKRKLNDREPVSPVSIPPIPRNRFDAEGKAAWKKYAKVLADMGVLTEADQGAFEVLIFYWAEWRKYSALAQKKPFVKAPRSGYLMISPFVTMAEKALKHYKEICLQFGLTPASRTGIKVDKTKEDDPVEAFRKNRLKRVK